MKMFAKILCLIMALAMMVSCFAACGGEEKSSSKKSNKSDEELIVGTWVGEVNLGELLGVDKEIEGDITLVFKKNGEYTLEFDEKAYKKALIANIEAGLEAKDMTEDDFEEEYGMSIKDYVEENFEEDECKSEGEYEIDDDELIIDGDTQEYKFKGDNKLVMDFDGVEVTFKRD